MPPRLQWNPEQVARVEEMRRLGHTLVSIAAMMDCSVSAVSSVLARGTEESCAYGDVPPGLAAELHRISAEIGLAEFARRASLPYESLYRIRCGYAKTARRMLLSNIENAIREIAPRKETA